METKHYLSLPDGKRMMVVENAPVDAPRGTIVLLPGGGNSPYDYSYHVAARRWQKKGWRVIRPAVCWWEQGCRRFDEGSIAIFNADMEVALRALGVARFCLIGHSYGGVQALVYANQNPDKVAAVSLWDSSFDLAGWGPYLLDFNGIKVFDGWARKVVGPAMLSEYDEYTLQYCLELAAGCAMPVQVVIAGQGMLQDAGKAYYKAVRVAKEKLVLAEAGHSFWEGKAAEKLADRTLKWFERGIGHA